MSYHSAPHHQQSQDNWQSHQSQQQQQQQEQQPPKRIQNRTYASLFPHPEAAREIPVRSPTETQPPAGGTQEAAKGFVNTRIQSSDARVLAQGKNPPQPPVDGTQTKANNDIRDQSQQGRYNARDNRYNEHDSRQRDDQQSNKKMLYDPASNKLVPSEDVISNSHTTKQRPDKRRLREQDGEEEDVQKGEDPQATAGSYRRPVKRVETSSENKNAWQRHQVVNRGGGHESSAETGNGSGPTTSITAETAAAAAAEYEEALRLRREQMRKERAEAQERHLKAREQEANAQREARAKERAERGPRTKGVLYRFGANGELEQVWTAAEIEERAAKREIYLEQQRVQLEKMKAHEKLRLERLQEKVNREKLQSQKAEQKSDSKDSRPHRAAVVSLHAAIGIKPPSRRLRPKFSVAEVEEGEQSTVLDSRVVVVQGQTGADLSEAQALVDFTEVRRKKKDAQVKSQERKVSTRGGNDDSTGKGTVKSKERSVTDGRSDSEFNKAVGALPGSNSSDNNVLKAPPVRPVAWLEPQSTLEKLGKYTSAAPIESSAAPATVAPAGTSDKVESFDDRRGLSRKLPRKEKKDRLDPADKKSGHIPGDKKKSLSRKEAPHGGSSTKSKLLPQEETMATLAPSIPEVRRPERDDEGAMDIQSVAAAEALSAQRNPSSYSTFVPGVGLQAQGWDNAASSSFGSDQQSGHVNQWNALSSSSQKPQSDMNLPGFVSSSSGVAELTISSSYRMVPSLGQFAGLISSSPTPGNTW